MATTHQAKGQHWGRALAGSQVVQKPEAMGTRVRSTLQTWSE